MKEYSANSIRNIALGGHSGSGKTSLAEAMLFKSGATDRLGKTADGNTVCDFDPEEIKRQVSVSSSVAPFEWKNNKINMIDTPGLFDFEGAFSEGIRAADTLVICISARSGVKVGTIKAYKAAKKAGKNSIIFVSKMDTDDIDFFKVLDTLKEEIGSSVCPLVVPVVGSSKVEAYVNVIDQKAYQYDKSGKSQEVPVADTAAVGDLLASLTEAAAETDDALMEKFFSGEKFTREELIQGVKSGIKNGSITPVLCGSAFTLEGIDQLLDTIVELAPSAEESAGETCLDGNDKPVLIKCDEKAPLVAFAFKTVADPFVGKLTYFKVISGVLTADMNPVNARNGGTERIGKTLTVRGKKQEDAKAIRAGDIGAVTKLVEVITGDTICDAGRVVRANAPSFPKPCMSMGIKTKAKGDESKISGGLQRLIEEDPTLGFVTNNETHQQILSGLGEQHIDVTVSKLKSKFGVEVELEQPIVPYRETIRKKVKVEGKHKKQTGGHGQFGHVWMEFEPYDGTDLLFEENVFGGSVPKNFFPAVEKGIRESIKRGTLAGYPVVGLKATLVDGSYHPVDSSEMSFKLAAQLAYKAGLPQASPILLEPIGNLKVYVPENNTGDIMGELNKRRGRVLGMNPSDDKLTLIEAEAPMSEMHDFTTLLRSVTQGRGHFEFTFERYEPLPSNLEASVIEQAKHLREEEKE